MKKQTRIFSAIVLVICLVGGFAYIQRKSDADSGIVRIGGVFGLSGDVSSVSWGEAARNGTQLAIDDINARGGIRGKKVELITEDMQSTSRGSVSAVSKLINIDHVASIVGPTWLDVYQGAADLIAEKNIVLISPDAGIEAVNGTKVHKNVFSAWYRTDVKAKLIAEYMAKHGVKRLAVMLQNDAYYSDFSARMSKYAALNGIEVVATELVNEATTDIRTPALKLAAAKPDVIIFGLYDEKTIINFLNLHKDTFPKIALYGDEFVHDHYFKPEYQNLYEMATYFHAAMPESDFVQRYKKRFGTEPEFGAGPAYDSTMIIAKMLEDEGLDSKGYDAYLRSHEFDTVSYGNMTFDAIGGVQSSNNQFDLWQIRNNKAIKVN
ncbi:MAG: Extracellular ligand-binding receptor [Candidatus Taylorbacteria bacterium]|nr:Extracellular ligand-binding receptor [Candidatus Taylorbacteria bacterium]